MSSRCPAQGQPFLECAQQDAVYKRAESHRASSIENSQRTAAAASLKPIQSGGQNGGRADLLKRRAGQHGHHWTDLDSWTELNSTQVNSTKLN